MWAFKDEGMEYESVRICVWFVSTCEKTEKSASNNSLALLTGTEKPTQSPAGERVVALRPFDLSQALTASTDS